jgi:hypothetical protein
MTVPAPWTRQIAARWLIFYARSRQLSAYTPEVHQQYRAAGYEAFGHGPLPEWEVLCQLLENRSLSPFIVRRS